MLRIECPECGTSYSNAHLKLKTKPGDKAIIRCVCGKAVEVEFAQEEVVEADTRSLWARFRGQPVATKSVVTTKITIADE